MPDIKHKNSVTSACILLIAAILLSIPISSFIGSASLSFGDTISVYLNQCNPSAYPISNPSFVSIVWDLRLPRILLSIAVGSSLALSGTTMQALTKNVMAEPFTLGIASGASTAAAFAIAYISGGDNLGMLSVSAFAFIGASIAMFTVYLFASAGKNAASGTRLILTGVVISMISNALTQMIISTVPQDSKIKSIVFWTMGSMSGARWTNIALPLLISFIGYIVLRLYGENLNLMAMGNDTATTLGVPIKRIQKQLIVVISSMTGIMVAASGCIGFVGLIIPHVVRRFTGADHRKVLPVSALLGALFLVWADTFSRTILAPQELPIGVLTALIGGPFFLVLLRKERSF